MATFKTSAFQNAFPNSTVTPPPNVDSTIKIPTTPIFKSAAFQNAFSQTPTTSQLSRTGTISPFLGGGEYNIAKNPTEVFNTGHTTYGGKTAVKGQERDDIIPVALGGANTSAKNIQMQDAGLAAKSNAIEKKYINAYKSGKMPLGQARLGVITEKDALKNEPMLATKIIDATTLPLESAVKISEWLWTGLANGIKAITKASQVPAGVVTQLMQDKPISVSQAYQQAGTAGQYAGEVLKSLTNKAEKKLIENQGGGAGLYEYLDYALVAALPEITQTLLDDYIIPGMAVGALGSELVNKQVNLKVTPDQLRTKLANGEIKTPQGQQFAQELIAQNKSLEISGNQPRGGLAEIVGKYLLGGAEKPTNLKIGLNAEGQPLGGVIGEGGKPAPVYKTEAFQKALAPVEPPVTPKTAPETAITPKAVNSPIAQEIQNNFIKTYQEFKPIPKGQMVENPDGLVNVGAISDNSKNIIGTNVNEANLTRRTLKHISEKPNAFPEEVVKQIPEIVSNPTEIRLSGPAKSGENRYLFVKQNGEPLASVVEVAVDKNKNTVVTVFKTDKKYLSDFDLLWKTEPSSEGVLPSASAQNGLAGSRSEFSALKESQNLSRPSISRPGTNVNISREKPIVGTPIKPENLNQYRDEIVKSLELAEPGQRIFQRDEQGYLTDEVVGQNSSFPDWIPPELRKTELVKVVAEHINKGTFPTKANEVRLYNVVAEEMGLVKQSKTEVNQDISNLPDWVQEAEKLDQKYGQEYRGVEKEVKNNQVQEGIPKTISVPEAKNKQGSVTLQSGLNPNIDKFIEEDFKPSVKGVFDNVLKAWDTIKKIFVPSSRGKEAEISAAILRKNLGKMARQKELIYQVLTKSRKIFVRYSKEQSLNFIDKLENGESIPGAEKFTTIMREALDSRWKKIQEIKGTDAYIENYFPHIWKDPEKTAETLARYFGKRPFEGTKSFLKQRKIPTIKEGVALGLEPTSYNPVDLIMAKLADMDRYLMAQDVWQEMKGQGLVKFVRFGGDMPSGWRTVDDKISRVFYNPKSKEFFDEQVMATLEKVAKDFGITHERVMSGKGLGGGRLGVSFTGQNLIKTKFATPEDVLLHEIGHQLDEKFDLQKKFVNIKDYKHELRNLADLRFEGKQVSEYFKHYVRKGTEKIAVMFQAYLHVPERFKAVAPNTYKAFVDFLGSDQRLVDIRDIKKSLVFGENVIPAKYIVQSGNWYMPEQSATILNNYLSPGLVGNPFYDAFRMLGNSLNQVQLGLSAFHALFTSGDAVISKAALEIQKAFQGSLPLTERAGSFIKAITSPISAPYYLWKNIVRGNRVLENYYKQNPEMVDMVDALEKAGGRVKMDSFYLNNSVDKFLKAFRSGNVLGAVIRSPGAMIETIAKPLMQWLVPRQKLGVFADGAENILRQAKLENWSEGKTILRLQEMWDSVDNRMGQMVYDNLFWNKVLKDLGMVSVRSLGWNLGDVRELGGGAKQFLTLPYKIFKGQARMTPKMAYMLMLPFVVGVWGAIIYYLYNGKAPEQLLDFYYPKTGKKKPDGTDERIALPSYMKDVIAVKTEGLIKTGSNKLHPEIAAIIDMFQNKDYYGTEIRNPSDPLVQQIGQLFAYQAKQFVPFSITNLRQRQQAGENSWGAYLQSFGGITPAPAYITRTPLQKKIYDLYDKRFGGGTQSQEQSAIANVKSDIKKLYYAGKNDEANQKLNDAVDKGIIKNAQTFIRDADIPNDIKLFQRLSASDQENLVKNMQLYELRRYAWYVNKDLKDKFSSISDNTKLFVEMEQKGDVQEPEWKKMQEVNH